MDQPHMLTTLGTGLLAEAFPLAMRPDATKAAEHVLKQLHARQWTERFAVQVGQETILIPARLHFALIDSNAGADGTALHISWCLQTRSNDGFQRQAALRHVLTDIQPWSVPFVVALIGEYVIEILHDIQAAMSPRLLDAMTDFISANPDYWQITKQRAASYWNVYYRSSFRRDEYVGLQLTCYIDAALRAPILAKTSA